MTSDADRLRWIAGFTATLALLPLLAGCLFDTREPEPPQTAAINYLPRSSAGNVWENCRLALVNKDSGGWDTAISEQFVYVPDGDTESSFPAVNWASWGKEQELNFVGNWFGSDVTIEADLLDTEINTPDGSGGIAEWDIIYFVTVIDNQSGSSNRYRGRAVLELTLEGSYWYLSYWRDEQGEQDPENPASQLATMGALRGAYSPSG